MLTLGDIQQAKDNFEKSEVPKYVWRTWSTPYGYLSWKPNGKGITGSKESIDWIIQQERKFK